MSENNFLKRKMNVYSVRPTVQNPNIFHHKIKRSNTSSQLRTGS